MYTRINASTHIPDATPFPAWLSNCSAEQLADTSWIPEDYNNGETFGYNWWPSTDTTRETALFERRTGEPVFTVDLAAKTISFYFEIEDWAPEEIAAYKQARYREAANPIALAYEARANEIANQFDFFGSQPMLTALSFQGSMLEPEASRAVVLATWRDAARVVCQTALASVLATGLPVYDYDLIAMLPAAPAIPGDPAPDPDPE